MTAKSDLGKPDAPKVEPGDQPLGTCPCGKKFANMRGSVYTCVLEKNHPGDCDDAANRGNLTVEPVPAKPSADELAQFFHETYERFAPDYGYETRKESAKPWAEVPDQNKNLMRAVCGKVIQKFRLSVLSGRAEAHAKLCYRIGHEYGNRQEFAGVNAANECAAAILKGADDERRS